MEAIQKLASKGLAGLIAFGIVMAILALLFVVGIGSLFTVKTNADIGLGTKIIGILLYVGNMVVGAFIAYQLWNAPDWKEAYLQLNPKVTQVIPSNANVSAPAYAPASAPASAPALAPALAPAPASSTFGEQPGTERAEQYAPNEELAGGYYADQYGGLYGGLYGGKKGKNGKIAKGKKNCKDKSNAKLNAKKGKRKK